VSEGDLFVEVDEFELESQYIEIPNSDSDLVYFLVVYHWEKDWHGCARKDYKG